MWLIGIPLVLLGVTIWDQTLLSVVPTVFGIFLTFIVGLFVAPISTVGIVWLAFAVAVLPLLFFKFPGQYNFVHSLTVLPAWPLLAAMALIAEREEIRIVPPEDVPKSFNAKVTFIDVPGTDADYLMVVLDEFGQTAFFCDDDLESRHGLAEGESFVFQIEVKAVDELGDDVLWIKAVNPVGESNSA